MPQFSQSNIVDVYLFHADSDQLVDMWLGLPYGFGHIAVTPNDSWWGAKGTTFTPGKNLTQTYFFVLVASGANSLSQPPQTTFTATRDYISTFHNYYCLIPHLETDLPNSILSSQSAASVASASAASASAASASSASVVSSKSAQSAQSASAAASSSKTATTETGGALQNSSSSSNDLPHWAIALLAVFGFLAFISFVFVFWLLIRKLRTRRNKPLARRNSIGSESPMMANIDAHSPTGVAPGSSSVHGEPHSTESGLGPLPTITARHNVVSSDGASTVSRADSGGGPFSAVDAAAMAAAFRNVMRKPDFADRPMEEGESPEHKEADVLNRELAEEGRDIRSVSSSRGVRVETLSEPGDAVH